MKILLPPRLPGRTTDVSRRLGTVPREQAVTLIIDLLAATELSGEALAEFAAESAAEDMDDRQYAQAVIRRLRDDGWLEFETNLDYTECLILLPHSETRMLQQKTPQEILQIVKLS